jgi:hypothetical protein
MTGASNYHKQEVAIKMIIGIEKYFGRTLRVQKTF